MQKNLDNIPIPYACGVDNVLKIDGLKKDIKVKLLEEIFNTLYESIK
jgi:hypothetical protein